MFNFCTPIFRIMRSNFCLATYGSLIACGAWHMFDLHDFLMYALLFKHITPHVQHKVPVLYTIIRGIERVDSQKLLPRMEKLNTISSTPVCLHSFPLYLDTKLTIHLSLYYMWYSAGVLNLEPIKPRGGMGDQQM